MITSNLSLELVVQQLRPETTGHWSVVVTRPPRFVFEAGDWIDFEFTDRTLSGGKTFSLSSSPSESDLMITFREGISSRKKALLAIRPKDVLVMTQFGNDYGFQLNANKSSVLIAGGVGIAPFRSMLKEMVDTNGKNDVTLIYLNQTDDFLFKNELDEWVRRLPNLKVVYIATKLLNRKKRETLIQSFIKSPHQNFYISGPPGMVESNEHLLIDLGVPVRNIRIDSFGGY